MQRRVHARRITAPSHRSFALGALRRRGVIQRRCFIRGGALPGVVLAACLLVAGCDDAAPSEDHPNLRTLLGTVVTAQPLLVPDPSFKVQPNGRWYFADSAALHCYVHEQPDKPLVLHLQPFGQTAKSHIRVEWDGDPILEGTQLKGAPGEISIPPDKLTIGRHRLRLSRAKDLDKPRFRQRPRVVFERMAYGLGGAERAFELRLRPRYDHVARFLKFGSVGNGDEQMEGCLFDGPGRVSVPIVTDVDAEARLRLENTSAGNATFTCHVGGGKQSIEVFAGESRNAQFAVPAGQHTLTFEVAGPEDGLFLWGKPYLHRAEQARRTPVVLVTLDTTRRDALSPYGGLKRASPNIQEFADAATVYDNAYATGSWTLPTHSSMFTGMYPYRHGAGRVRNRLLRDYLTLAEIFRDRGYFTAGFAGGMVCGTTRGVGQGFLSYRNPEGGFETRGDRLTDAVGEVLHEHGDEPLFLFVNYFDPHALFAAPPSYQAQFGVEARLRKATPSQTWARVQRDMNAFYALINGKIEVTKQGMAFLRAAYHAEVAFMDDQLGRLFGMLRSRGLYDDALIILVADHGELLGERGFVSHSTRLDAELTWVPLLIKRPGQKTAARAADLVSHVDLFPTILETAFGPSFSLPRTDGISLLGSGDSERAAREFVLMEEHDVGPHKLFDHMKLGKNANHVYALQRLRTRETWWNGGITAERWGENGWVAAAAEAAWADRMEEFGDFTRPPVAEDEGALSKEEEEGLRRLGYVK